MQSGERCAQTMPTSASAIVSAANPYRLRRPLQHPRERSHLRRQNVAAARSTLRAAGRARSRSAERRGAATESGNPSRSTRTAQARPPPGERLPPRVREGRRCPRPRYCAGGSQGQATRPRPERSGDKQTPQDGADCARASNASSELRSALSMTSSVFSAGGQRRKLETRLE